MTLLFFPILHGSRLMATSASIPWLWQLLCPCYRSEFDDVVVLLSKICHLQESIWEQMFLERANSKKSNLQSRVWQSSLDGLARLINNKMVMRSVCVLDFFQKRITDDLTSTHCAQGHKNELTVGQRQLFVSILHQKSYWILVSNLHLISCHFGENISIVSKWFSQTLRDGRLIRTRKSSPYRHPFLRKSGSPSSRRDGINSDDRRDVMMMIFDFIRRSCWSDFVITLRIDVHSDDGDLTWMNDSSTLNISIHYIQDRHEDVNSLNPWSICENKFLSTNDPCRFRQWRDLPQELLWHRNGRRCALVVVARCIGRVRKWNERGGTFPVCSLLLRGISVGGSVPWLDVLLFWSLLLRFVYELLSPLCDPLHDPLHWCACWAAASDSCVFLVYCVGVTRECRSCVQLCNTQWKFLGHDVRAILLLGVRLPSIETVWAFRKVSEFSSGCDFVEVVDMLLSFFHCHRSCLDYVRGFGQAVSLLGQFLLVFFDLVLDVFVLFVSRGSALLGTLCRHFQVSFPASVRRLSRFVLRGLSQTSWSVAMTHTPGSHAPVAFVACLIRHCLVDVRFGVGPAVLWLFRFFLSQESAQVRWHLDVSVLDPEVPGLTSAEVALSPIPSWLFVVPRPRWGWRLLWETRSASPTLHLSIAMLRFHQRFGFGVQFYKDALWVPSQCQKDKPLCAVCVVCVVCDVCWVCVCVACRSCVCRVLYLACVVCVVCVVTACVLCVSCVCVCCVKWCDVFCRVLSAVRWLSCCRAVVLRCVVFVVVCCGVLRCFVLCCLVSWCVVLCCAVLCCVVLCCGVLCCAVLCCAVWSSVVLFGVVLYDVLCCVVWYDVVCCVVCVVCVGSRRYGKQDVHTSHLVILFSASNIWIWRSYVGRLRCPPRCFYVRPLRCPAALPSVKMSALATLFTWRIARTSLQTVFVLSFPSALMPTRRRLRSNNSPVEPHRCWSSGLAPGGAWNTRWHVRWRQEYISAH